MDTNKKTILLSIVGAILAAIAVQQIAYRNSLEYKISEELKRNSANQGEISQPRLLASSQQLDMAVPDPEFCRQWGASAFVMSIELYTTMNPTSSFVARPALKPGCVVRRDNWTILEKEGMVSAEQMRQCKENNGTFAYTGSIKEKPVVRCVSETDENENGFLDGTVSSELDELQGLSTR